MPADLVGLKTVRLLVTVSHALHTKVGRHVQHQRQIRTGAVNRKALKRADEQWVNAIGRTLINARGVDETIAEYPIAALQCRTNDPVNVVSPSGSKKHRLA